TLRCTNSSPGISPTTSLAGTRLSEQPIHRNSGRCWRASRAKNSGSCARNASDQLRLLINNCLTFMSFPVATCGAQKYHPSATPVLSIVKGARHTERYSSHSVSRDGILLSRHRGLARFTYLRPTHLPLWR